MQYYGFIEIVRPWIKNIPFFLSDGKGSEADPPKPNSAEILRQVSNARHLGCAALSRLSSTESFAVGKAAPGVLRCYAPFSFQYVTLSGSLTLAAIRLAR